ncbi:MAG TPA: methyltransferase domain-containing protein [Nocardioides sp.]|uniref:class I SAM-dependent methyltransferase n=1 Tax=Nocardioides sp. TaxID=35761 RepID=UPI002C2EA17B|nr:methyltransferase domain-containing protein [Nocardioides sp.]HTW18307.1 methyltransferase domain-containing protein [Nocardioides sp.]
MTDPRVTLAHQLVAEWERQQEVYIAHREVRFELMLDVIDRLAPRTDGALRVVDLACGPGSATERVLRRFPEAEVVSIDLDPLLLELGRLHQSEAERQPTWLHGDLRDPAWIGQLPHPTYDAVVSTTALHWLTGAELSALYELVRGLMAPGGVFLNGDYLPATRPHGTIARAVRDIGVDRERTAVAAGALDWKTWWERVRAEESLAAEVAAHDEVFKDRREHESPSRAFHLAALREAGFREVDLVWHDLAEGLVCAVL